MEKPKRPDLSIGHNLKIALFHLGSGMADVLATGVWNRIMVADLGFSATFVGLLTGLRYFLAPVGVIAGRFSDTHTIGGFRRLFWIWLGRAMMAMSTVMLGFATAELVRRAGVESAAAAPPVILAALVFSFLLFSLGVAVSGSTFLALIYDRAAEHQRGRAVGLVWTFLLIGFAVGGLVFSLLLPQDAGAGQIGFTAESLLNLFIVAAGLLSLVWFLSLLGEERRSSSTPSEKRLKGASLRDDLSLVWRDQGLRLFLCYLTLSMAFAFLQDTVLEPFAGQVFGMDARVTNRFAAYWGSTAILGSFIVLFLLRRWPAFNHGNVSQAGIVILMLAYLVFAASSLGEIRPLVTIGLILLGVGLGVWNIGTLGLMMDLSPAGRAGTFLGFWTLCVTFARGGGVAGGGILRDVILAASGQHTVAYGAVFCCGLVGLFASLLALRHVKLAREQTNSELAAALSSPLD